MTPEELSVAVREGKLEQAATDLEGQREKASSQGRSLDVATISNDLGVVLYSQGRYADAAVSFQCAQDNFRQCNDSLGLGRALGNLARLKDREGSASEALALYSQAADLFHEVGERTDEFVTLRSQSKLYLKRGGWLQAVATFDRALLIKPGRGAIEALLHWIYQIPLRILGLNFAS